MFDDLLQIHMTGKVPQDVFEIVHGHDLLHYQCAVAHHHFLFAVVLFGVVRLVTENMLLQIRQNCLIYSDEIVLEASVGKNVLGSFLAGYFAD